VYSFYLFTLTTLREETFAKETFALETFAFSRIFGKIAKV